MIRTSTLISLSSVALRNLCQRTMLLRHALIYLLLTAPLSGGCVDPVQQEQVAALGPEEPGVAVGPLHRSGQPCLICHSSAGEASRFTAAGTVYGTATVRQPIGGVKVRLIDASRRSYVAYTNCVGNFFVLPGEFEPVMPMWASLSGYDADIDMESPMHKDGDCGFCHKPEKSPSSAGPIFLTEDPQKLDKLPRTTCSGTQE